MSLFAMFGVGPMELTVIGILAVLLFGARLPKIARSFGSTIVEFKKGLKVGAEDPINEVRSEFASASRELKSVMTDASNAVNKEIREVGDTVHRATH